MKSRRQFISVAGTGLLATAIPRTGSFRDLSQGAEKSQDTFTLGMAGYTFKEFTVEQTIEMMKRTMVSYISLKDFHLPMTSSRDQTEAVLAKFRNAGITVYTLGVIYMKTPESVDLAFEYAGLAGVKMIVGAPNYELLPYVEKKVKAHDIRLAIHNHGPDNPLFPNAADIWNHIRDLDPRIGICLDIGHTKRDRQDPAIDIEKYSQRLYDVHIKDVDRSDKEGTCVEIGRGIIDIPGVVAALRSIKYNGKCSLEFEKDMKDPLAGIAESIGYWKGVTDCKK
jgi:sugar phosphate isomerase/epimerase